MALTGQRAGSARYEEEDSTGQGLVADFRDPLIRATRPSYFSFTKSKTKIAHTPTVTGN